MKEVDFMSTLHKSTKRDYLARVNDKEFPKAKAASIAKKWGLTTGTVIGKLIMEVINI